MRQRRPEKKSPVGGNLHNSLLRAAIYFKDRTSGFQLVESQNPPTFLFIFLFHLKVITQIYSAKKLSIYNFIMNLYVSSFYFENQPLFLE